MNRFLFARWHWNACPAKNVPLLWILIIWLIIVNLCFCCDDSGLVPFPGTVTLVDARCKSYHSLPLEKVIPAPDAVLTNRWTRKMNLLILKTRRSSSLFHHSSAEKIRAMSKMKAKHAAFTNEMPNDKFVAYHQGTIADTFHKQNMHLPTMHNWGGEHGTWVCFSVGLYDEHHRLKNRIVWNDTPEYLF